MEHLGLNGPLEWLLRFLITLSVSLLPPLLQISTFVLSVVARILITASPPFHRDAFLPRPARRQLAVLFFIFAASNLPFDTWRFNSPSPFVPVSSATARSSIMQRQIVKRQYRLPCRARAAQITAARGWKRIEIINEAVECASHIILAAAYCVTYGFLINLHEILIR